MRGPGDKSCAFDKAAVNAQTAPRQIAILLVEEPNPMRTMSTLTSLDAPRAVLSRLEPGKSVTQSGVSGSDVWKKQGCLLNLEIWE